MGGGGEEELWLAQGKALRDPRPDDPHLLGTDNLRGEGVRVKCQLHIPPGDAPRNTNTVRDTECRIISVWIKMHLKHHIYNWEHYLKSLEMDLESSRVKTTHLKLWNNQCSKRRSGVKMRQKMVVEKAWHKTNKKETTECETRTQEQLKSFVRAWQTKA